MDKIVLEGRWIMSGGDYRYYVGDEEIGIVYYSDSNLWVVYHPIMIGQIGSSPTFKVCADRLYEVSDRLVGKLDPLGRITIKHPAELPVFSEVEE